MLPAHPQCPGAGRRHSFPPEGSEDGARGQQACGSGVGGQGWDAGAGPHACPGLGPCRDAPCLPLWDPAGQSRHLGSVAEPPPDAHGPLGAGHGGHWGPLSLQGPARITGGIQRPLQGKVTAEEPVNRPGREGQITLHQPGRQEPGRELLIRESWEKRGAEGRDPGPRSRPGSWWEWHRPPGPGRAGGILMLPSAPGCLQVLGCRCWAQPRLCQAQDAKANTGRCGLAQGLWVPENWAFVRSKRWEATLSSSRPLGAGSELPRAIQGVPGGLPRPPHRGLRRAPHQGVSGGVAAPGGAEGLSSRVPAPPCQPPGLHLPIWKVGPRVCVSCLARFLGRT